MKKTILALLLVLGMMASVLAGCGNAAASAEASGSAAAAASEAAEAAEGPAEVGFPACCGSCRLRCRQC